MAVPTRSLSVTLTATTTDSNQSATTTKLTQLLLTLTDKPLSAIDAKIVYPLGAAGTVSILPPTISAGMEFIIIPNFATGEPIATQRFSMSRTVGGTPRVQESGPTIMAGALLGTETAITITSAAAASADFVVFWFKRDS
jgi:hypothetical protein